MSIWIFLYVCSRSFVSFIIDIFLSHVFLEQQTEAKDEHTHRLFPHTLRSTNMLVQCELDNQRNLLSARLCCTPPLPTNGGHHPGQQENTRITELSK